jgi:hypothetical protein
VGLDVGFIDEIEPAQSQAHYSRVGIMTGPDGVDIVPLHQQDILEHRFAADILAGEGIVLVAVDAREDRRR